MTASDSKALPAIGFFTVLDQGEKGHFGGYLILNAVGRPLEFHCTAPVKANRAQEILYGETLRPYLYGEQIGEALLKNAKSKPLFVCTDLSVCLTAREVSACPITLIRSEDRDANELRLREFSLGEHKAALLLRHEADQAKIVTAFEPYQDELDLIEPFLRIREAIEEAHGLGSTNDDVKAA